MPASSPSIRGSVFVSPLVGMLVIVHAAIPGAVVAQGLDLTVNHVGLAIGEVPRVTGIRLNFRDRNLEYVRGLNATVWTPSEPMRGRVDGIALRLPATGAAHIKGLAAGVLGVGARDKIEGIDIGGVGVGGGGDVVGLSIGGVGVGAQRLEGIILSGIGAGAETARAGVLAPFYFKIEKGGEFTGGSISAYNRILGRQHGLTIGLINYARALDGVQLGLINILDRPTGRRVTVLVNAGSDR